MKVELGVTLGIGRCGERPRRVCISERPDSPPSIDRAESWLQPETPSPPTSDLPKLTVSSLSSHFLLITCY